MCLSCDAPKTEAPELIEYDEKGHCYFKRQPQKATELGHAIQAVRVSCIEAVQYGGSEPDIWRAITQPRCVMAVIPPSQWETVSDKLLNFLRKVLRSN